MTFLINLTSVWSKNPISKIIEANAKSVEGAVQSWEYDLTTIHRCVWDDIIWNERIASFSAHWRLQCKEVGSKCCGTVEGWRTSSNGEGLCSTGKQVFRISNRVNFVNIYSREIPIILPVKTFVVDNGENFCVTVSQVKSWKYLWRSWSVSSHHSAWMESWATSDSLRTLSGFEGPCPSLEVKDGIEVEIPETDEEKAAREKSDARKNERV